MLSVGVLQGIELEDEDRFVVLLDPPTARLRD
jgi:hypothetical protein